MTIQGQGLVRPYENVFKFSWDMVLKDSFQLFDTDKDGFISRDELRENIAKFDETFTNEEIDQIFTQADTNSKLQKFNLLSLSKESLLNHFQEKCVFFNREKLWHRPPPFFHGIILYLYAPKSVKSWCDW